jgi:hypothetical protein
MCSCKGRCCTRRASTPDNRAALVWSSRSNVRAVAAKVDRERRCPARGAPHSAGARVQASSNSRVRAAAVEVERTRRCPARRTCRKAVASESATSPRHADVLESANVSCRCVRTLHGRGEWRCDGAGPLVLGGGLEAGSGQRPQRHRRPGLSAPLLLAAARKVSVRRSPRWSRIVSILPVERSDRFFVCAANAARVSRVCFWLRIEREQVRLVLDDACLVLRCNCGG